MDRPTFELTLPDSQAKVTLYTLLTHGDFRQMQREILKSIRLDLASVAEHPGDTGHANEVLKQSLKTMPGTVAVDEEDIILSMLVVKIVDCDGAVVTDTKKFIYNLTGPDGNKLYAETERISQESNLTGEAKKK